MGKQVVAAIILIVAVVAGFLSAKFTSFPIRIPIQGPIQIPNRNSTKINWVQLRREGRVPRSTNAGLDVFAAEDCTIPAGQTVRVQTGIALHAFPTSPDLGYNRPGGWVYVLLVNGQMQ